MINGSITQLVQSQMVQSKHATMVQKHVQGLGAPRWICANTSATTRDTNAISDGAVAAEDGFGAEDGADGAEGAQADRQGAGGGGGRGSLLTSTGGGTAGGAGGRTNCCSTTLLRTLLVCSGRGGPPSLSSSSTSASGASTSDGEPCGRSRIICHM